MDPSTSHPELGIRRYQSFARDTIGLRPNVTYINTIQRLEIRTHTNYTMTTLYSFKSSDELSKSLADFVVKVGRH